MIIHKPDYIPAKIRIPLSLHYDDPATVQYPEVTKYCDIRKLRNKHEPTTGEYFVDLLIKIQSEHIDIMPKVWDNFAKGLTAALPKDEKVKIILHQTT